ncbi:MAG TPA: hypothetical protein VG733_11220 [Chthoniobacteraceae bacterium]|nr:hypothetical protein [Chthoniobacteraceae bacterium]
MKPAATLALLLFFAGVALAGPPAKTPSEKFADRLEHTLLADFNLRDTSLQDTIDLIQKKAREADPDSAPVPIKLGLPQPNGLITMSRRQISAMDALWYVTDLLNLRYTISKEGVTIFPAPLLTREYYVPEEFFGEKEGDAKYRGTLEHGGVAFPDGSSAAYHPGEEILTLRNTPANLDNAAVALAEWLKTPHPGAAEQKYAAQLEKTIIAQADFKEASMDNVLATILKKAKEADPKSPPVPLALAPRAGKTEFTVTLSVKNIPEITLLHYVAGMTGEFRITRDGVVFLGGDPSERLVTWEYLLPQRIPADSFDDDCCHKRLADAGVPFSGSESVHVDASKKTFTVTETRKNLELVDQILDSWDSPRPQQ